MSKNTRVIQDAINQTGRSGTESVEDVKITNDHAFYKLICEKVAHRDFSVPQFNLLYNEISEKMIHKPFTIQEVNDFCRKKGVPLFKVDELLKLVPEDTKDYVDYKTNTVKNQDHGYIAENIKVQALFTKADLVDHHIDQNYIVDSDAYYGFLYAQHVANYIFKNLEKGVNEQSIRQSLNLIKRQEVKDLLEKIPNGGMKEWFNDQKNRGYTDEENHVLYEKISEELVHTSMNINQIKEIYNKYNITPPTEDEFKGLVKIQEEKRSSDNHEEKTGLTFQGRINIKVTEDGTQSSSDEFNLNIDLFQDKNFEDLDNDSRRIENNEGLLKELEATVKTFNTFFGIKKDNNPLLTHGDVANFRLFLFPDKGSYQNYLSDGRDIYIPGGGAAQSSDNNYISNMYSHAENSRGDFNHDGKSDYNDYNYVIKHEFVHALTFYLTSKLDLGKVLMEGLAEYVTHLTEGERVADFAKMVDDKYKGKTLKEIIKGDIDPYKTGAAVIAYIEQTYPNFIDNLLYAATEDRKTLNGRFYLKKMMEDIYKSEQEKIKTGEGFQKWVKDNSVAENNVNNIQHDEGHISSTDHNPNEQVSQEHRDQESDTRDMGKYGTPGIIAKAASNIYNNVSSSVSNWWSSGSKPEVEESDISTSQNSLRGLDRRDEMQSQASIQSISRSKRTTSLEDEEQERTVFKNTILKIEESRDQNISGKHKANVTIEYNDIKALYDRAEGTERQSVLKFWNKLHESGYKIGVLPEEKYYFENGKFIIHDSSTKKLIVLPKDKISLKIMKLDDDYDLVITDNQGKLINIISKIDDLNYDLLSNTNGFSLETSENIQISDPYGKHDSYLINGLGEEIFQNYGADHNFI
ncbi:hypothetical protein [Wolbachia endosymbiont of Pentidionis agamae]|uniref:hypothetical protein n=1 Tax=Wolbachia endosymbiont of Pentidionis agamae TaxID=3110435 RepID=UPI002FD447F4